MDGIRAVSILLVVLGHLPGTVNYPSNPLTRFFAPYAHLGVTVFFVISGFLITTLLLREQEHTGTIDLAAFYIRRSIRIMPAFVCFLIVISIMNFFVGFNLTARDYLHSLTYTVNFESNRPWAIGHLWSLSVEEQFYLLWPAIFSRATRKVALVVAICMFAGGPIVRILMHLFIQAGPYRDLEIFPAVADPIAAGCILAILRPRLTNSPPFLRFGRPYLACATLALTYIVTRFDGYSLVDFVGTPLLLIGVALLIESYTRQPSSVAKRMLNAPVLVFVGNISYSLYLWQQPFLNRHASGTLNSFPVNLIACLTAAVISYKLVEQPCLRFRTRWIRQSRA